MTVTEPNNYVCDGDRCGMKRMNDTNHWWVGWTDEDFMLNIRLLNSFDQAAHENLPVKHFCGIECLMKWTSKSTLAMVNKR